MNNIIHSFEKADVQIFDNHAKLDEFLSYLDSFDFWFTW